MEHGIELYGNVRFRGTLAGATGDFSGRFSATNVDAVDYIHIRDGSVSAYYQVSPSSADYRDRFIDFTFAIPAQSFDTYFYASCNTRQRGGIRRIDGDLEPTGVKYKYYEDGKNIENSGWLYNVPPFLTFAVAGFLPAHTSRSFRLATFSDPPYPSILSGGYSKIDPPITIEIRKR